MSIYEGSWEHVKTGHRYRIRHIGVEESSLVPVVIYEGMINNDVWTRPVEDFFDGRFVRPTEHPSTGL